MMGLEDFSGVVNSLKKTSGGYNLGLGNDDYPPEN